MADSIEPSYQAAIDAGKIHGAIVFAADASKGFIYNKVLGHRVLPSAEKQQLQPDDVLCIASGTKLITTIAALQCIEKGQLTLTGDLSSLAPELVTRQVITSWSEQNEPVLEASTTPITLEMLLTHSAGLSYYFADPLISKWQQKYNAPAAEPQPVEEIYNQPLGYQPGSSWMYGSGMDWAGRIVERVTGLTLGEYMQQNIFEPLGIADAQFYPVSRNDLRARMVDLNPDDPEGLGKAVFGGNADINKLGRGHFGGHGLFITGTSFTKILHSLLANDGTLLKPTTADDMFRNHLSPEAASQIEPSIGPAGSFLRMGTEGKVGYGLGGLLTLEDADGWYGERTLTWGGGVTFTWFIDRKMDLCGFAALQATLPVDGVEMARLKDVFRRDVYRKRGA
jgi:CubicO group peptidase (beta-lactamase class C family)